MYTCKKCGSAITPANMHTRHECTDCCAKYMREYRGNNRANYNRYMRAYMRMARDYSDVPNLRAVNGKLHIYFQGEKLV